MESWGRGCFVQYDSTNHPGPIFCPKYNFFRGSAHAALRRARGVRSRQGTGLFPMGLLFSCSLPSAGQQNRVVGGMERKSETAPRGRHHVPATMQHPQRNAYCKSGTQYTAEIQAQEGVHWGQPGKAREVRPDDPAPDLHKTTGLRTTRDGGTTCGWRSTLAWRSGTAVPVKVCASEPETETG